MQSLRAPGAILFMLAARLIAQQPVARSVDPCILFGNPTDWNGTLVEVRGRIESGVESGPFLRGEGCLGPIRFNGLSHPSIIQISNPGRVESRFKVDFKWDDGSDARLDEARRSFNPFSEIVTATVVGLFETEFGMSDPRSPQGQIGRSRAYGGPRDDAMKILVKTVKNISIIPLTEPPSKEERAAFEEELATRGEIMWKNAGDVLRSVDGPSYFEYSLRGASVPGGVQAVQFLRGRVVSVNPLENPPTIEIEAVLGRGPEVRLRLIGVAESLIKKLAPNVKILFRGIAVSFISDH